jgi:glyoxylase-like metal-dependent hydrolase (beta-lactamase superfamily II)
MVGGNMVGLIGELERLIELVPAGVKIIPGHGPIASIADVRTAVSRLKGMQAVIVAGIDQGKTFEQLKEAGVLDEWKPFLHKDVPIDYYIFNFYRDLTALRSPR